MQEWPVNAADARANVWDLVVVDHMVGEALNSSVYAPIAKHFPLVKLSNFGAPGGHHTDPTGKGGKAPQAGTSSWPYIRTSAVTPLGEGAHVGTHQSISIYGEPNSTMLNAQSDGIHVRTTAASAFGTLVLNTAMLRDMYFAAPTVPIQPWISPKYGVGGFGPTNHGWSWYVKHGSHYIIPFIHLYYHIYTYVHLLYMYIHHIYT